MCWTNLRTFWTSSLLTLCCEGIKNIIVSLFTIDHTEPHIISTKGREGFLEKDSWVVNYQGLRSEFWAEYRPKARQSTISTGSSSLTLGLFQLSIQFLTSLLLHLFSQSQWWVRRGFGGSALSSLQGVGTPLAPHATRASSTRSYQSGSASTKVEILSSMVCAWSSTTAPLRHSMRSWTVSLKRFPCHLGWETSPLLGAFMRSTLWMNWRMANLTSALTAVK